MHIYETRYKKMNSLNRVIQSLEYRKSKLCRAKKIFDINGYDDPYEV